MIFLFLKNTKERAVRSLFSLGVIVSCYFYIGTVSYGFDWQGLVSGIANSQSVSDVLRYIPYVPSEVPRFVGAYERGELLHEAASYGLGYIPGIGGSISQNVFDAYYSARVQNMNYVESMGDVLSETGAIDQLRGLSFSDYAIGDCMNGYEANSLLAVQRIRSDYFMIFFGDDVHSYEVIQAGFINVLKSRREDPYWFYNKTHRIENNVYVLDQKLFNVFFLASQEDELDSFEIATVLNSQEFPISLLRGNLCAAVVMERYGLRLIKSENEVYRVRGEQLLKKADKLLFPSRGDVVPFELYPYWLTYCATKAQFANLSERAETLFQQAEEFGAKFLTNDEACDAHRVFNNELRVRFLLSEQLYDKANVYIEDVVKAYEISFVEDEENGDEKNNLDSDAILTQSLYSEMLANQGLLAFFQGRDDEANLDFVRAARLFKKLETLDAKQRNDFDKQTLEWAFEKQNALACRQVQLACRARKYEEAKEILNEAREKKFARLKAEPMERFKDSALYHSAFIAPSKTEGKFEGYLDESDELQILTEEQFKEKNETWIQIYNSHFIFENLVEGSLCFKRGDYDKACEILNDVYETIVVNQMENSVVYIETLRNRAQVERELGGFENLLKAREDVLNASNNQAATPYLLGALACAAGDVECDLAEIGSEYGSFVKAKEYYDIAEKRFDTLNASDALYVDLYYGRAIVLYALGETKSAIKELASAIKRSKKVVASASVDVQDRAVCFSQFSYLFETYVGWVYDSINEHGDKTGKNLEGVYRYMEQYRLQSFGDLASLARVDWKHGAPNDLLEHLTKNERSLYEKQKLYQDELKKWRKRCVNEELDFFADFPKDLRLMCDEVKIALDDYSVALNEVKLASVKRGELLNSNRNICAFETIAPTLKQESSLVCEYLIGERRSFLLVYGADVHTSVYELMIDEETRDVLSQELGLEVEEGSMTSDKLYSLMFDSNSGFLKLILNTEPDSEYASQNLEPFEVSSSILWTLLFPEELREVIVGDNKTPSNLVIIPDGILAQLPFEALITSRRRFEIDDESKPRYLLDDAIVTYSPSAALYYNLCQNVDNGVQQSLLTVGDPDYSENDFARLWGSRDEVNSIAQSYGELNPTRNMVRLLQNDATEENVVKSINSKYVHLACHGLANYEFGKWKGSLVFTPGNSKISSEDGYLTLGEIFKLDMSLCSIAVLSACKTNIDANQQGEGIWSLSRGVLASGAKRVVASNWNVDDESTASLISTFMESVFKEEKDKRVPNYAQALREAKIVIKEQNLWREPYYWAPFVLCVGQ